MASKGEQVKKCFALIEDFCNNNKFSINTKKLLDTYFGNYLSTRRVPTTIEMELKLNKLIELGGTNEDLIRQIITKALECGWASFYPIFNNNRRVDSLNANPQNKIRGTQDRQLSLTNEEF